MEPRKYRGLTKEGEWVYGWYCKVLGYHYIIPNDADIAGVRPPNTYGILGFIEVIPKTVGQSTGRKDKKRTEEYPEGQEIFGGDIVNASIYCDEKPQTLPVYYSDRHTGYIIDYECSGMDCCLVGDFAGSLEVIGTIHEDKEY